MLDFPVRLGATCHRCQVFGSEMLAVLGEGIANELGPVASKQILEDAIWDEPVIIEHVLSMRRCRLWRRCCLRHHEKPVRDLNGEFVLVCLLRNWAKIVYKKYM